MKDDVLNILRNEDKSLDAYDIQHKLNITDTNSLEELLKVLNELEDENIIYHTKKDRYMLIENSHLRKGIMRVNKKGFGFVELDGLADDIYIDQDNMNGAIHDDEVLVEITSKMNIDRLEGRVLKIIKRTVEQYMKALNPESAQQESKNLDTLISTPEEHRAVEEALSMPAEEPAPTPAPAQQTNSQPQAADRPKRYTF